jgi:hypothetical protein
MGMVLTTEATMMCPHGGTVTAVSSNMKVLAGTSVLRPNDTFIVAGCVLNVSGAPHPCVTVEWQMPSTKVNADGAAALTTDSIGMCKAGDQAIQGTVMVMSTQMKVSAQ